MGQFGLKIEEDDFRAASVYSDETAQFRTPPEPLSTDAVEIRLRAGAGMFSAAFLCTEEREYCMEAGETDGLFTIYRSTLPPSAGHTAYYFRLQYGEQLAYYTKYGYFREYQQEGWFRILRDFQTPDWAKGAVTYQIFTDRFCNGDRENDVQTNEYFYLERMVQREEDWAALPSDADMHRFYGGDLQGVMDKLDYLRELGVEVIYFNPIFVSPSNHKYDAQDYAHIDPHLGKIVKKEGHILREGETNAAASCYISRTTDAENLAASDALFAELVRRAHEKGIRILIDGVFNHCGSFHKWMDREGLYEAAGKGAFAHPDSPYREYFYWQADGTYEGWWGHSNHPKLNLEHNEALRREILGIAEKWLQPPYDVDGWRVDVAADIGKTEAFNHQFWRTFRQTIKAISPEKLLLAEHYGDASAWLGGDEWDTIMNYDAFMEPVTWFLTGVSKHSTERRDDLYNNADAFWGTMAYQMGKLPMQALQTAMNELSNHDHSRFLTRTNRRIGRLHTEGAQAATEGIEPAVMREAVLLQMTWIGSPTIYYGDEAGVVGWTDPDNRRTYPWGREDMEMLAFHKKAIAVRKENPVCRGGSLKQLYGKNGVIGYGRFDAAEKLVVVLNNAAEAQRVSIPVWQIGVQPEGMFRNLLTTTQEGFTDLPLLYAVEQGEAVLLLPPKSGMILKEV